MLETAPHGTQSLQKAAPTYITLKTSSCGLFKSPFAGASLAQYVTRQSHKSPFVAIVFHLFLHFLCPQRPQKHPWDVNSGLVLISSWTSLHKAFLQYFFLEKIRTQRWQSVCPYFLLNPQQGLKPIFFPLTLVAVITLDRPQGEVHILSFRIQLLHTKMLFLKVKKVQILSVSL